MSAYAGSCHCGATLSVLTVIFLAQRWVIDEFERVAQNDAAVAEPPSEPMTIPETVSASGLESKRTAADTLVDQHSGT